MKCGNFLSCAVAVLALAACNKNKDQTQGAAAANEKVTITQANPPPGGTWADVVNETSAGGYLMGNPNATVKLLEVGSLSCPHCQKFEEEGVPPLVDKYVKTGKVSWEFRPYIIHGPIDMAANLVIRCNGLKTFFPLSQALYKDQPLWLAKVEADLPKHRPRKILHCLSYREDYTRPTFVVDISTEFDRKLEAIRCYGSQFDSVTQAGEVYPNGDPLYDIVRHQAAHYGSLIRARYGEPFFTTETMRVDDITTLEVSTF